MRTLMRWPVRSLIVVVAMLLTAGAAWSYWSAPATGPGAAVAASVNRGSQPAATADGTAVTVTWSASTVSNGDAVDAYLLTRYDSATLTAQPALATCSGAIAATTCAQTDVPSGSWVYAVTPVIGSHWLGAESPRSAVVVVGPAGVALGRASAFSVLGATGVTSTEATVVSGDLGVSPSNAVTGFPPGVVSGDIHADDQVARDAQVDLQAAYTAAAGRATTQPEFAGDLNGTTFLPGVRHAGAAVALTGTLTLDGGGDPNAVFIFQIDAALNTAAASNIVLINGARASNVYWQVVGAAGIGANATFSGTILAQGAITVGAGAELIGRALSRGAVTMAANTIRFTAALPPTIAIDDGATDLTTDPTPTISGTTSAAPGRAVTVSVDGQTLSTTVLAGGTWSVTAAPIAAGQYPVVARVRDASGNASSAQQLLTVEISPAPVDLGRAGSFAVLGATAVANLGSTVVAGDLGVSPGGAITGFPPGVVNGSTRDGTSEASNAQADAAAAYADAASRPASRTFSGDQIGQVFRPGVHRTTAAFALTGLLTFNAGGDPDAVFIVQVGAALNTSAAAQFSLVGGAQASNIYWQAEGAVGLGAGSSFVGTILTPAAITLGAGAQVTGRALSTATVSLAANTVTRP